jgi:hypothetical protein
MTDAIIPRVGKCNNTYIAMLVALAPRKAVVCNLKPFFILL